MCDKLVDHDEPGEIPRQMSSAPMQGFASIRAGRPPYTKREEAGFFSARKFLYSLNAECKTFSELSKAFTQPSRCSFSGGEVEGGALKLGAVVCIWEGANVISICLKPGRNRSDFTQYYSVVHLVCSE